MGHLEPVGWCWLEMVQSGEREQDEEVGDPVIAMCKIEYIVWIWRR